MSAHNGTQVPIPSTALRVCRGSRRKLSVQKNIDAWLQRLQTHSCSRYLTRHRLQTLAELLSNLERVTESGEGWSACCPAHPDSRPSLSVHAKSDGRFLLKCHPGCKFEDIVHAAGMTLPEMFDTALSTRTAIQPPRIVAQVQPKVTEAVSDFEKRQEIYSKNATDSRVDVLASDLGVSSASLQAIGIGWCVTEDCWTFPEFNGRQQLCGIVRRFRSGEKRSCKGGHRGLTLPQGWKESGEPLYICEGQSDVAAAISKGMRAIGRPGISAGLGDLAALLQEESGKLIVVSDNDKHDEKHPKAKELARKLADTLKRPVELMAPPSKYKDLREFLTEGKSCP